MCLLLLLFISTLGTITAVYNTNEIHAATKHCVVSQLKAARHIEVQLID